MFSLAEPLLKMHPLFHVTNMPISLHCEASIVWHVTAKKGEEEVDPGTMLTLQ